MVKDSVNVKTKAYIDLFPGTPESILKRIENHHKDHGGMSRYKKIPLYLEWSGIEPTEYAVKIYENKFADTVLESVINSPWVSGVHQVLMKKTEAQKFVIVTGTPQSEIEIILKRLDISHFFDRVYGAPIEKSLAIEESLSDFKIMKQKAIMIGDSESDYKAALDNGITFLFRDNGEKSEFAIKYSGSRMANFEGLI